MRRHSGPRHGWFTLPGRQSGDRTVADQLKGLEPALAGARGKSVLDLGCAEGAIALEFAKAGASRILGLEVVAGHLEVARELCAGYPCEFQCVDLNRAEVEVQAQAFDTVLALAIIHKLKDPAGVLRYFAGMARERVIVRMPAWAAKWRFSHERGRGELIDCAKELAPLGFSIERIERGPTSERGQEPVVYFRRLLAELA
jgi:SAM-dependent methyltransferase